MSLCGALTRAGLPCANFGFTSYGGRCHQHATVQALIAALEQP